MRYAEMFARSKHSQKWGIVKIRNHLQMHGISSEIIEQALENIDTSQEIAILEEILRKKLPYLKAKTPLELKQKLLRYAIGKGYNYSTAAQAIKNIRQNLTAD